ncbi:HoxN/HupN/NixA family nickel/cobalt transporter [Streptomyces sp. NBC_01304]|uniref:HoxN/HupN/NixA family nickel/cobalt transporter n=1 Tax=Streptomyces sp. NBC_01304 TaxID=2903818 RepID=UPI002E14245F|nr:nickel transporter [Streptomyces sp. NBC_01304]
MAALALLGIGELPAAAHPLGNFTVNRYHGLRVFPDRVEDTAVVDRAEIPTLQASRAVDADRDGQAEPGELAAHAGEVCAGIAREVRAEASGRALSFRVTHSRMEVVPGEAGLRTSRITCALSAAAELGRGAEVVFADESERGRIGWREITAGAADGVRLAASDVPGRSVSGELRRYPDDLLADPLEVRRAVLRVAPGAGGSAAEGLPGGFNSSAGPGTWLTAMDGRLASLAARDGLTLPVGLAAVFLALLLGAGHAALPGHGKTVMAACMAGRRGGVRDAAVVGATVTFTHTAGVLALGLLITVSASLAADRVLSWLGVAGGAVVTGVGVMLLRGALRGKEGAYGHSHGPGHGPGHGHGHGHSHGHVHGHSHEYGHSHEQGHGPDHHDHHDHHDHVHQPPTPYRRFTLLGMGVAGGLVPSPSALVVLLGAMALNRTAFGVGLVLAYGLGMAAVLTAAGLLVARLGDRAGRLNSARARRIRALMPRVTAALVVAVGLGLALRSAVPLLHG